MLKTPHALIALLATMLFLAVPASAASFPVEAMVYYTQTASASPKTCNAAVAYDSTGSGPTQLLTLSSGATIFICGYTLFAGNGGQAQLVYGTGSNCATGRVALTPQYQLTAQTPIVDGGDYVAGLQTATSNALCIVTNYTYYRTITIDHTKVGTVNNTDQSNFPVLISGTYADLATVANGGYVQNANGYDIIFTSDSAGQTVLPYEVESYNASSGAVNFWVKVPTVSHSSDTVIYMWYGNPVVTTSQANATGVWDTNYQGVWHMADNAANTTIVDSTGQNNGTYIGANTSTVSVTGKIYKALAFSSSTNATMNSSFAYTNNFTVESWVVISGCCGGFYSNINSNNGNGFTGHMNTAYEGYSFYTNGSAYYVNTGNSSSGAWVHYVINDIGGTVGVYLNGSLVVSAAGSVTAGTGTFTLNTFYANVLNGGFGFGSMYMNELRVSNTGRTADWIKTSYNNQNSPSTFYTVGSRTQP